MHPFDCAQNGEAEDNPSFMQSLAAFTARNQNNFSYVDFYPIFSTGVGYSF